MPPDLSRISGPSQPTSWRWIINTNKGKTSTMRDLNYQLKQLCKRNRDGSFQTQAGRARLLNLIANQLHELGYRHMSLHSLKPKHIEALVRKWLDEGKSPGRIKNCMSCLRWWAQKINRASVIARSNRHYGIPDRTYVTNNSKAVIVDDESLANIRDDYIRMSIELQRAFGLRREESIKFIPRYADLGDRIRLKPSWTKGGRPREIPLLTKEQREVLDRAHQLAGNGSLIPANKKYVSQLHLYDKQVRKVGLSKLHGLRHAYAQKRYLELTGWPSPAVGGPTAAELGPTQRKLDREARLTVSAELGHAREVITVVYLGR